MKRHTTPSGFTLIELLVCIGIIGVLAALTLPSLSRSMRNAKRVQCLNNLRQIGIAFQQFADLNNNKYPMQLAGFHSSRDDSSGKMGFLVLSERPFIETARELASPKLVVCAADPNRNAPTTFEEMTTAQISYLVSTHARPGDARTIVVTDRNVVFADANALQLPDHRIQYDETTHELRGNVLMGDGRVEWVGGFSWQPNVAEVPSSTAATNAEAMPAPTNRNQPANQPGPSSPNPDIHSPSIPGSARIPGGTTLPSESLPATNHVTGPPLTVTPSAPPPTISLISPDDIVGKKRLQWWWLLFLLLLAMAYWYFRRTTPGEPGLKNGVEFYTGAAINAEAMLATLEENGIPARRELVHPALRENESEMTRPLRIFVGRDQIEEATRLFSMPPTDD